MYYQTFEVKCASCGKPGKESSKQYSDRIRRGFNTRFNCLFCQRIFKSVTDPEHAKWLEERRLQRSERTRARQNEREKIKELKKRLRLHDEFQNQIKQYEQEEIRKRRGINGIRSKRMRQAISEIEEEEIRKVRTFYENSPDGYHVDHIIPISKGGKHCLKNLRYVTAKENCEKGNKIIPDVIKRLAKGNTVSIPWLQMTFRLTYEDAKGIFAYF